jgi:hypothetical protein
VSLILQAFPDFTPPDLVSLLQSRAVKLGQPELNNQFGTGRLNLGHSPELAQ